MPSREGHTPLGGQLTDEAHDGWSIWCDRYGLDVTATLEAIGLLLTEGGFDTLTDAQLVERARQVMKARKSRRRR